MDTILERILADALEDNDGKVSIGNRTYNHPCLPMKLIIKWRNEKIKLMTNNSNGIQKEIEEKRQTLRIPGSNRLR